MGPVMNMNGTDEYLRNNAVITFSIVPSALGIPQLLPFLKPVCKSKDLWRSRHTGVQIVGEIAISMGNFVVPHLTGLVEAVGNDVTDENEEVRIGTALALAALAEASAPNGTVFMPLLKGVIGSRRGKVLAVFLIAFDSLIPQMDAAYAIHFAREVMGVLVREFDLPDEQEMQIVLKTVKQCASVEGVKADYNGFLPEMFKKLLSLDTSS